MNPQTNITNENTVPQWAKDAAAEHVQATINTCRTTAGLIDSLAQIIAKHAPKAPDKPSIWRPVSVKPTLKDADAFGEILCWSQTCGMLVQEWNTIDSDCTFWMVAPQLPKEQTQEEKDRDFLESIGCNRPQTPEACEMLAKAIAYGRATATTATGGRV